MTVLPSFSKTLKDRTHREKQSVRFLPTCEEGSTEQKIFLPTCEEAQRRKPHTMLPEECKSYSWGSCQVHWDDAESLLLCFTSVQRLCFPDWYSIIPDKSLQQQRISSVSFLVRASHKVEC